jgi:hypothetical protein
MHPSDVGTSLGSGGTESLAKMFKDRCEEKEVQNDVLQETWVLACSTWFSPHHCSFTGSSIPLLAGSIYCLCRQVVPSKFPSEQAVCHLQLNEC